jgi:predicted HTH transcriptional regulator
MRLKIGAQVALSARQMKLIEYLSDKGGGIMNELRDVLPMVSDDTILRDLKDLLKKGIIDKEGSTKASRYIIKN